MQQGLGLTAIRPIVPSLDDIYRTAIERPLPKGKGVKRRGTRRPDSERRPGRDHSPEADRPRVAGRRHAATAPTTAETATPPTEAAGEPVSDTDGEQS